MTLGVRILRLLFPSDERQRMALRQKIAVSAAHTEDMQRTLVLDGKAIREAVMRFKRDRETA